MVIGWKYIDDEIYHCYDLLDTWAGRSVGTRTTRWTKPRKIGKIITRKGHIVEPVEHARQGVHNNLATSTFPNILEDRIIYSNR